jgi:hypothetical protein
MESVRLTVICDWAQSPNVCVQLSDKWARVTISCSAPINAAINVAPALMRAARMVCAGVDSFDPDTADMSVALSGYDMCASDELHHQITEQWVRALMDCGASPAASVHTTVKLSDLTRGRVVDSTSAPTRMIGNTIPQIDVERQFDSTEYRRDENHANTSLIIEPSHAPKSHATVITNDRRDRMVRSMVQTVQQYVKTYGSAPDFKSDKPSVIEKVHNYIRSTTTRQNAPHDILEAVRHQLATGK